eukprot:1217630-Alexandrium_andersonii.AAC.1
MLWARAHITPTLQGRVPLGRSAARKLKLIPRSIKNAQDLKNKIRRFPGPVALGVRPLRAGRKEGRGARLRRRPVRLVAVGPAVDRVERQ